MKKIVVLVSGGGTNLQAIIDALNSGKITNGKIEYVISSNPKAYALERAKNNGINTLVIPRKEYKSNLEYTKVLLENLKKINPDLIVLAGFMIILDKSLIEAFPNRVMNVHPSLIPSFCGDGFYGLHVHEKALEKGVKVTGATVHFVNEICDGGPIILQKAIDIDEDDTPEMLQKRVMENCEWKILPKAINLFCNDKLQINGNKVRILK